jgi:hypothetical protein
MGVSVFVSVPRPHKAKQEAFIKSLRAYLASRGMDGRTLGVTDYDTHAPLSAVRRVLIESNGLLAVAFRRVHVETSVLREGAEVEDTVETRMDNYWLTSPWTHIETAMAFQMGLPILVLRERGVVPDGILERGVTGIYLPEFDLDHPHFSSDTTEWTKRPEWSQLLSEWEGYVRHVVRTKGLPPRLYY